MSHRSKRPWRHELQYMLKFFWGFFQAIKAFRQLGPCVTVYGSARFEPDHPHYQRGLALGQALAQAGLTVMTGGGPGVMQAANQGAMEAGGASAGCSIELPHEDPNPYLTVHAQSPYFFIRKLMLTRYSVGFIALPGGYGTLDELFEMITLVQTRRMEALPIVLLDRTFWAPLIDFIVDSCMKNGTVSAHELDFILVTDSIDKAIAHIKDRT